MRRGEGGEAEGGGEEGVGPFNSFYTQISGRDPGAPAPPL